MDSTKQEYTPGWAPRSTGLLAAMPWGIDLLSKGRVIAGALIGDIQADAGSIGTAELATGAVTSTKVGAAAILAAGLGAQSVTSTKLGAGAVMGSNVGGTVETISTADTTLTVSGIALLTKATTVALAITIPPPTAGQWKAITNDSNSAVGFTLTCSTTTVTFDGTNKTLTFNALNDSVQLMGSGTTRWVVIANNSVTFS